MSHSQKRELLIPKSVSSAGLFSTQWRKRTSGVVVPLDGELRLFPMAISTSRSHCWTGSVTMNIERQLTWHPGNWRMLKRNLGAPPWYMELVAGQTASGPENHLANVDYVMLSLPLTVKVCCCLVRRSRFLSVHPIDLPKLSLTPRMRNHNSWKGIINSQWIYMHITV